MRPSCRSFSSVIRATSRRTPSKADSTTALGVSSMMKSTPVRFSSARMLRPSRPMMRPFMSSEGSWTTDTVVSAAWPAARRCIATDRIERTRRSASRLVSSSMWRTRRARVVARLVLDVLEQRRARLAGAQAGGALERAGVLVAQLARASCAVAARSAARWAASSCSRRSSSAARRSSERSKRLRRAPRSARERRPARSGGPAARGGGRRRVGERAPRGRRGRAVCGRATAAATRPSARRAAAMTSSIAVSSPLRPGWRPGERSPLFRERGPARPMRPWRPSGGQGALRRRRCQASARTGAVCRSTWVR